MDVVGQCKRLFSRKDAKGAKEFKRSQRLGREMQGLFSNSTMQARNVKGTLDVTGSVPSGPVLLVDDIVDSRWTLTLAGWLLRTHGSGTVHPFVLARATARKA